MEESPDFDQWKEKYREHLAVKNYSAETIQGHLHHLKRFFFYLNGLGIHEITSVTKETLRDYQTHLYQELNRKGEPNTVGSQNNALKAVKGLYRFLSEEDYLVSDPAKEISYAREPRRLPRSILTQSEARKVLHAPQSKTILGYRDRAILEVLYSTGIRRKELCNLSLQDIDTEEGFIRIDQGKGKKDRVVPIGKIACRYLHNYITSVRPSLIRDPLNHHLFLSLYGRKIDGHTVLDIVKYCARKARVKKNISPHTFRHTCATLMLRNKANIRHIQEMLGHSSLNSTQVYASVSITDLKEVHSRCHPRERDND